MSHNSVPTPINMQTSNSSSKKSVWKFYQMLGKDIIAACLHMDRQGQENHIQWSATVPTKELCPFLPNRFSKEYLRMMTNKKNTKSTSLCFKFTMKKSKTCSCLSTKEIKMAIKLENIRLWESMSRIYQNTVSTLINQLKKK